MEEEGEVALPTIITTDPSGISSGLVDVPPEEVPPFIDVSPPEDSPPAEDSPTPAPTAGQLRGMYRNASVERLSDAREERERLIELYRQQVMRNRTLLRERKHQFDRLTKYFFVRKTNSRYGSLASSSGSAGASGKSDAASEERYRRHVEDHMRMRKELLETQADHQKIITQLKTRVEGKRRDVASLRSELLGYKMRVAKKAVNSRTGKPIDEKKVQEYQRATREKDAILRRIRTKFLLLQHKKEAIDLSLKDRELSEGLHLIDFEQYKMENAQLNDKIEEKSDTLSKSKLKAIETVHILTHVNEKLQFIKEKDNDLKQKLASLETRLKQNKDYLTTLKRERDDYKKHNQHLRDTNPLIGNNALLEDYENRKSELEELRVRLDFLKKSHERHSTKTRDYQMQISKMERRLRKMQTPSFGRRRGMRRGRFLPGI